MRSDSLTVTSHIAVEKPKDVVNVHITINI